MTPQEIIEGNQLLAEFMGYVNTTPTDPDFNIYENSSGEMLEAMSMKYHSSWDWLMCIVEKIESLGYPVKIKENNCWIILPDAEEFGAGKETKLHATWTAVVSFIEWYNQNKASEETKSCPNCKETKQPCACMRNICYKCGKPVGNITFTICDECWDIEFPRK